MNKVHFEETVEYQAKTSTRQWTIQVIERNSGVFIVTTARQKDSTKPVVSETQITEGKNLGKKNQTTPLEQAVTEAKSKLKKIKRLKSNPVPKNTGEIQNPQLQQTVTHDHPETDAPVSTRYPKPMLLHKHDPSKVVYPCIVQPKFNGVRCLARREGDSVVLYSRQLKLFPRMSAIRDQIASLDLDEDVVLDGELYFHGKPLQEIIGVVRRQNASSEHEDDIVYVVYDAIIPGASFEARLAFLFQLRERFGHRIQLSPHQTCADDRQIQSYFESVVANGYEGVVVRNGQGRYLSGYRSFDAVKYKAVEDCEFKCVGFEAGKRGKDKDKLMLVFVTEGGKKFLVRPNMPLEKRGELYKKIKDDPELFGQLFEGKPFTLVYHSITKDGIPSHIIDCVLRDYE